jgi:hypothetical protein
MNIDWSKTPNETANHSCPRRLRPPRAIGGRRRGPSSVRVQVPGSRSTPGPSRTVSARVRIRCLRVVFFFLCRCGGSGRGGQCRADFSAPSIQPIAAVQEPEQWHGGPKDLARKRIGISSYQNTLGVRQRGSGSFYGVPWKSVTWVAAGEDVVAVETPGDVKLERAKNMAAIEQEFVAGKIHALFVSRFPRPFLDGDPNVGRLFADPAAEEERYLRKEGYFPIMHVLAFKRELRDHYPELPAALFQIFETARRKALERWNDPNWSMLLWGWRELERQEKLYNFNLWRNGLEANRPGLWRTRRS